MQLDCLSGLGMLSRSQDDPNRALMYFGKCMEIADQLGDVESRASVMLNMGNVLMQVRAWLV